MPAKVTSVKFNVPVTVTFVEKPLDADIPEDKTAAYLMCKNREGMGIWMIFSREDMASTETLAHYIALMLEKMEADGYL